MRQGTLRPSLDPDLTQQTEVGESQAAVVEVAAQVTPSFYCDFCRETFLAAVAEVVASHYCY